MDKNLIGNLRRYSLIQDVYPVCRCKKRSQVIYDGDRKCLICLHCLCLVKRSSDITIKNLIKQAVVDK